MLGFALSLQEQLRLSVFTLPVSGHHLRFGNLAGLAAHIFERLAAL